MSAHKITFQHFVQTQLNEAQKSAVVKKDGSLLVIAGAGSGKTRVITSRITYLILEHKARPESIIALTFTNKAAKEMQERVSSYLPEEQTKPVVATFHSYCVRLLKKYSHLLPFNQFSILDSTDQQKLLASIIKQCDFSTKVHLKHMLYAISEYKNSIATNSKFDFMFDKTHQFMQVYNAYEQEKRASHCLDFDDLLLYTLDLFKKNESFKQSFQEQIRHILVDEYQDTNHVQNELLKQMALDSNNSLRIDSICVVGDEDQSIYSWRGATVENILQFDKLIADTSVLKIEQNYRSTEPILQIANQVISKNTYRKEKRLWSTITSGAKPMVYQCHSDFQEAHVLSSCIQALQNLKEPLHSTAILYRTHAQSRVLEESLLKLAIPYKIIGGIQFYERKEIKDLLAYLKLVVNPYDKISALRILNCPTRGLGEKFEEELLATWQEHPHTTFAHILQQMLLVKQTKPKQEALHQLIKLFSSIDEQSSITGAINFFCTQIQYLQYLQDFYEKEEAQSKRENVYEFLRAAEHFEKYASSSIAHFLEEISLFQEKIELQDQNSDCVQLMTMHSAKGLEFDTVMLPGLEDGILPNNQSILEDNIEEERRLFYVGITRAKKRLLMTYSKTRNSYGQTNYQNPSRFLSEIPSDLIIEQQANYWSSTQLITYFSAWAKQQPITDKKADHVMTFAQYIPAEQAEKQASVPTGNNVSTFKKLQTVKHETFGLGIVDAVEIKGSDTTYVTVRFYQHGSKKIDAKFLRKI